MKPIVAEVRGQIPAPIETVFDVFARIDLKTILRGHGPLPAVVGVEDQTGDWGSVGESRIIRLADGSGMLETMMAVERPYHFAYVITELTSTLRFLITSFRGAWFFEVVNGTSATPVVHARWRYEFEPKSIVTRPFAWWVVSRYWQPYMESALELASEQAVSAARSEGSEGPAERVKGNEDG